MKLKPGPTRRVHANNTRGAAFCGLGAFVGVGKTQRAHVYTAATLPVGSDDYKKIDPERLTLELEVVKCAVNSGRFWMMDEVDYAGDDTVDFHGVKMNWAGDMTGAEMNECEGLHTYEIGPVASAGTSGVAGFDRGVIEFLATIFTPDRFYNL